MSQHHTLCRTSKKVHLMETDRVTIFHLLLWFFLMCTFNRTNLTTYPWVWFDLFNGVLIPLSLHVNIRFWISGFHAEFIYHLHAEDPWFRDTNPALGGHKLVCSQYWPQAQRNVRVTSGKASSIKSVPHQLPASIYRENLWGNKSTAKSTCVNTLPLRPATVISSWPVSLLFRSKKF